jgi:hypothetical protein
MQHLFSNGPNREFVFNRFAQMVSESNQIDVAAPYVSKTEELLDASKHGKQVNLLAGLNVRNIGCYFECISRGIDEGHHVDSRIQRPIQICERGLGFSADTLLEREQQLCP